MSFFKRLGRAIKKSSKFALNPAKGTREFALDKPKYAPYIGKAAGLFTFGIGEKVAQKGFMSDIKKGRVRGMGPNAAPAPMPQSIDTATPISITPGQGVMGERAQIMSRARSPQPMPVSRAQLAQTQPTRVIQRIRGQAGSRAPLPLSRGWGSTVGNAFMRYRR